MIVLGIDLGETTGYAFIRDIKMITESPLLRYGTVALGADLPGGFRPDVVVVERPAYVPGRAQEGYDRALAAYGYRWYKKLHVIRAVDWMQTHKHYPLPGRGVLATQHEKDAYRMAMWAMHKYGGGSGKEE
jgi:hypothetical protein